MESDLDLLMGPELVAVAGDWHGNTRWAVEAIKIAASALESEPEDKIILQLGDFGYWPEERSGQYYLDTVNEALELFGMEVWFLDGNHEDHPALAAHDVTGYPVRIRDQIRWLPRNKRWVWHGKTWLALGGAHSIDRRHGVQDETWFEAEEITLEQAAQAVTDGHADVMLTHDCPSSVPLGLPVPSDPAWLAELNACDEHRDLLDGVVRGVQPQLLVHGHYHMMYAKPVEMPWGTLRAAGLACDGMDGNLAVLDTRKLLWVNPLASSAVAG